MPSVNEVIERVDRVKVNPYEDADKARWLMELDGKIYQEVTAFPLTEEGENPAPPRVWPEEGDKPLLVDPPYDRLYDLYLFAMIDYHDREYAGYNNAMELFNAAMGEFRRKWRRDHRPVNGCGWKGRI